MAATVKMGIALSAATRRADKRIKQAEKGLEFSRVRHFMSGFRTWLKEQQVTRCVTAVVGDNVEAAMFWAMS